MDRIAGNPPERSVSTAGGPPLPAYPGTKLPLTLPNVTAATATSITHLQVPFVGWILILVLVFALANISSHHLPN